MLFDWRSFALAKDPENPKEYQDASAMDAERGLTAIADGVSSSLFSGPWASILTQAVVADPPDLGNHEAFARWLQDRRATWAGAIDTSSLAWFQRAKLPTGAFSTLLWLQVLSADHDEPGAFGACRLVGHAIGDSCMFQVRRGELVRTFPIQTSAELQADPIVLGSVDLGRDSMLEFITLNEFCYADDLIILCTDALADWALRRYEAGCPPVWEDYWDTCREDWEAEIIGLRHEGKMRIDDTTLIMLRVVEQSARAIIVEDEAKPPPPPRARKGDRPDSRARTGLHDSMVGGGTKMGLSPSGGTDPPEAEELAEAEPADGDPLDWIRTAAKDVRSVSEQMADQIDRASDGVARGFKSLKDKLRDKFGKRK
jgi:hypothetical protein